MKATFILSKDPSHESTGDLSMAKLVMSLARESYDIGVICLSFEPASTAGGHRRVPKAAPNLPRILRESLRSKRSLVHTRFVFDGLVDAVDTCETDIFVADHSYMAEAVLDSRHFTPARGAASNLAVSTVVPEGMVWKATRGVVGRIEAGRIVRDELRVARRAYSVGTYDVDEAEYYREQGIRRAHWLDLTLPPADEQVAVGESDNRLVFLGDRRWAPNRDAAELLLRLWPRIARGIDGAQLFIVGQPDPAAKQLPIPDGVQDLGFVDDLAGFLQTCRALVAPIRTGGGVRVKILDAASRGLPVVGTSAAVGSLTSVLGIDHVDSEEEFVGRCRRYLQDRSSAVSDGDRIYSANLARWRSAKPHTSVQDWLKQ